jgi:branched-chain amino acid transport system ATP-binding protein
MLAIARSLMAQPQLLLMDEPSLGLAPLVVTLIFQIIPQLRDQGLTILLVEQSAWMSLQVSDRSYVMESGRIVLSGPSSSLIEDTNVKRIYLGDR